MTFGLVLMMAMAAAPPADSPLATEIETFIFSHLDRMPKACRVWMRAGVDAPLPREATHRAIDRALAQPIDLPDFKPWRVLAVRILDPAAGPPGRMLCDLRLIHDSTARQLNLANREWIAAFRRTRPWRVDGASDEALLTYLGQIDALLGQASTAVIPRLTGVQRAGGRGFTLTYAGGARPALGKVELGEDGSVVDASLPDGR